jgi:hypothetical protein
MGKPNAQFLVLPVRGWMLVQGSWLHLLRPVIHTHEKYLLSLKYARATSRVRWLNGETKVSRTISVLVIMLMRTEMVLETLVYSPFNHLTRLLVREYFIEFSLRESFKLYISITWRPFLAESMNTINVILYRKLFVNFKYIHWIHWQGENIHQGKHSFKLSGHDVIRRLIKTPNPLIVIFCQIHSSYSRFERSVLSSSTLLRPSKLWASSWTCRRMS